MFMPICTDTALPSTLTTVLAFMYQPKLPVENCFTSASISWPLITIFSGSAFSMNWDRETGQEVLGGMGPHSHQKWGMRATPAVSPIDLPSTHGEGDHTRGSLGRARRSAT